MPLSGNGVGNVVKLQVTDSAGKPVADFVYGETGGALGGACSSEPRAYTVLDTVEMQLPYNSGASDVTPRFTYRALETGEGVNASFGITTRKAGADGQSCMFYNVVNGPQESPVFMFADSAAGELRSCAGRRNGGQVVRQCCRGPGLHADIRIPRRQTHDHVAEDHCRLNRAGLRC